MTGLLLAVIYVSFVSLGLPDALLGAAWPTMHSELHAGIAWAGAVSTIISVGTVVSSLNSDRLTRRFGPGLVTAVSTGMTAGALFGFSLCRSFPVLCILAIPYGLGAGGVDAAINNYVAVHYPSRHMSWLHCMWGVGAAAGPYIMGAALRKMTWHTGYAAVGVLQAALTAVLFISLPLWRRQESEAERSSAPALPLRRVLTIPGVKNIILTFFCYCALESTAGLWAASFLTLARGVDRTRAATFAGLFYIGMTLGRFINGFLTVKLSDRKLIRLGMSVAAAGAALMLLPAGEYASLAGLVILGLGCAPIYPCVIHSTPEYFGADRSQAIIGVQMASAYLGTALIPPIFGAIAGSTTLSLYPFFLLTLILLMAIAFSTLPRK